MTPYDTTSRHRLLLKLEALWDARPDATLGDVICTLMAVHAKRTSDLGYYTTDDVVEEALDEALAERGVTVSGGWQS